MGDASLAYFDNANSTKVDEKVIEAMLPYFREFYGTAGLELSHSRDVEAVRGLENARKNLAESLNADPQSIVFTSGATESNNIAIRGTILANQEKGKHIITTPIEVQSILKTCQKLEKEGFEITYLDVDEYGRIDLKQLEKAIRDNTILVSIQHANGEIGTVQPIEQIAQICKEHEIIFHTDATHSYLKIPIDTGKIPVNLITFDAHHIHGPKGIGALYIRRKTHLQRVMEGGDEERRLRPGVENVPGAVGFAKAVEIWSSDNNEYLLSLRKTIEKKVKHELSDFRLTGHPEKRLPHIFSMVVKQIEGESILVQLDMEGYAISTGSACSSKTLQGSHVLKSIGLPPEISHGSVRISFSRYNTTDEIDGFIEAFIPTVKRLRQFSPLRRGESFFNNNESNHHHNNDTPDDLRI
jgi:cysteine desulfurase